MPKVSIAKGFSHLFELHKSFFNNFIFVQVSILSLLEMIKFCETFRVNIILKNRRVSTVISFRKAEICSEPFTRQISNIWA